MISSPRRDWNSGSFSPEVPDLPLCYLATDVVELLGVDGIDAVADVGIGLVFGVE